MSSNINKEKPTYYKDLTHEEELELVLWLDFLEESIENARVQITRWKRNWNSWDLQMFFVAVGCIHEAKKGLSDLGFFAKVEVGFWNELKCFSLESEKIKLISPNGQGLRDNIHRDRIYNRKNKKAKKIPNSKVLNFGSYNATTDEYTFIDTTIKVSEAFFLVKRLQKNIKKILDKKLTKFYAGHKHKGMIPWTKLRSFNGRQRYNRRKEVINAMPRH